MIDLTGTWMGPFQLVRLLGSGAMGAVYLARDEVLRRDIAMKLIAKGEADTDQERHERFLREARAAARLVHPNVVQIFQVGEDDQYRFIAMEFVEGVTTARAAKQNGGRLPEQIGIEKMREAADALRLADSLGICHRDIKPANLLLTASGTLKIADFGLASQQVEGGESIGAGSGSQLEGTPYYMSPEQWTAGTITPRADVYGLGCTFYHLLVGATPYAARDLVGSFRAHTMSPVPDPLALLPTMDTQLAELLRRCMAKRALERPPSSEVVDILDDILHRRRASQPRAPRAPQPAAPPEAQSRPRPSPWHAPVYDAGPDVPTDVADHGPAGTLTSAILRGGGTTTREAISAFRHGGGAFGSQSYHQFFALTGYPFSDIRQPTSFWDAGPFASALHGLAAPLLAGERPAMLLGAPGSGRTFVCEKLRASSPRLLTFPIEPQLLFGARPMVALCRQLGVAAISASTDQRSLIEAFLLHALPRDRADAIAVAVVDGIGAEDHELLQELGAILHSAPRGRFSMVLVGAEDLPARLAAAGAPEALLAGPPPIALRAMSQQEMIDYIDFRMRTVGGSKRGLDLDIASQQFLYARSGGNPKLVNVFCHNALTIAALKRERKVTLSSLRLGMKSKSYLSPDAARPLLGG